ncbi:hypothetical protein, variant [Aphanomyces astaci]|uniref:UBX domain-containing protein n=1 Tax=Aphanomyces astaci TaxID=112090 RepID=W4FFG4_APHAT|nr:hypothetical protein H257_17329 [Aphanomyces astaci]XP_009844375.1 hypothetical protein, variant [Aphanomyces astaci]ETV66185.1 hypothetical protein H257_17329 [Aphanomyces astaci]ETV66186.1 hypothetical protein, variant [Aphanomyces astaci]|eukprot:XP_009844374.1 hypothetical protein H257_17329 [Aphanomyces astaci]
MDAESLASFMVITGADGTTAQQYLDLTNWNMDEALNLFMESGGSGTSSGGNASSSSGGNHDPFDSYGQQDVRAPDPSKRQRLVGGPADPLPSQFFGRGPSYNQFTSSSASSAASRPDALFQRDFAAEAVASIGGSFPRRSSSNALTNDDDTSARSRDPQSLSQLFQPPVNIMFYGTLSEARQLAKQESKWLLVNVQDDTVFASLRLNRDTWNDDFVQNLVTSGFVFWQIYIASDSCKKFCSLYQLDTSKLPITCVLDPLTGQKVVEWPDYIEPHAMAEKLSDFACLNPPGAAVRPVAPKPPPSRELTEDEELAAAIAASMEQQTDDDMGHDVKVLPQGAPTVHDDLPPPPSPVAAVPRLPDEPADGPTVTRVQIRTTTGSRLMRRFDKAEPVAVLFQFVQQEIPEARTRGFELRTSYPPATLVSSDLTPLADANLVNASLNMQWTT